MARRATDDDDDRDEPRPRRRREVASGGGTGMKAAVILAAIGLVVLTLCCGLAGFWAYRISKLDPEEGLRVRQKELEDQWKQQERVATSDQQRAKAFLDYWMEEVRRNNLDEAYRRTSAAYQARVSRNQFDQFVQRNPDLKRPDAGWSYGLDGKPGSRFTFLLSRPGPPPYALTVVREGDEWRLDDIDVK